LSAFGLKFLARFQCGNATRVSGKQKLKYSKQALERNNYI